ncbi:MAG: M13 family metallopeptidase [Rudaea sp.]|uniref:M13 family metallopeptidase n=1 Tax=unclassified Rudaea TaxID=2627037 RepID=UPI0010FA5A7F|nr:MULTISPECIES: M13 family metallopeptidase [unclassified Rudaea]MBN8888541.1 M13 family metallopeptidase [Rudaea sp.]MBR0347888.1 M13 family metallopeptidase [Rudaea sp.]
MQTLAASLRPLSLALAVAAGVFGAGSAFAADAASANPSMQAPVKADVVAANIDASINPGDDFFAYANGAWLKAHPIPAAEANYGIGRVVQDELYAKLRKISEDAAAQKDAAPGSDAQKIGDFWSTAMDEAKAEQVGLTPLKAELARIDAIKSATDALDVAFGLQPLFVDVFFSPDISQDEKASDVMAIHLYQGGLGLPERDYYFNTEAGVAKARKEYVAHMGRMLKLLDAGAKDADPRAARMMAFETELAKVSRKLEDLRDPDRNYNKMAPDEVTKKYTPSIVWSARLKDWNLAPTYVIVGQPEFFAGLQALLKKTPVPVLRDYLKYHLVSTYASSLDKAIDDENFSFYGKVLRGQKEQRPRWKRALDAENRSMGMILGRIFVGEYFPAKTKDRYNTIVEAIRTAYGERIDKLDWMSAATKTKAHEKLAAVTKKVGYPDKWKDYSALVVGRNSYAENLMNAARWRWADGVGKFGKPVDRAEWGMTPQTYNAYYNPSNNEIVLPAAQFTIPGFKDGDIDDAIVYGYAAASTVGHEITHGFDDEGRKFDAKGNLTDWWTPEDGKKFEQRADVMVKQFDAYEPLKGLHINGKASLGENIADYGGILIGLDAFKKTEQYKRGEKIAGFTPIQRFFLGYALSWIFEEREEALRQGLLSDVHAPAKWRVNGPLANIGEFHEAFGVKPGQPMYRAEAERVRIW